MFNSESEVGNLLSLLNKTGETWALPLTSRRRNRVTRKKAEAWGMTNSRPYQRAVTGLLPQVKCPLAAEFPVPETEPWKGGCNSKIELRISLRGLMKRLRIDKREKAIHTPVDTHQVTHVWQGEPENQQGWPQGVQAWVLAKRRSHLLQRERLGEEPVGTRLCSSRLTRFLGPVIHPIRDKGRAVEYMSRIEEIGPGWGCETGNQHLDGI